MSEAELHIMRARLDEGRRHKAARGELGFALPRGYLRRVSGEVVLDPDERVRDTIEIVFDVFARRRSVHGVLRYLVAHGIELPDRVRAGSAKGELIWRPPHRSALINMLTSPIYAGAYVYGRRHVAGRGRPARPGPSRAAGDWQVLIKGRLPAYIDWERFEENQAQLRANQAKHGGTPRGGPRSWPVCWCAAGAATAWRRVIAQTGATCAISARAATSRRARATASRSPGARSTRWWSSCCWTRSSRPPSR